MGEVYQATDAKLGRSVAVKFLPAGFAQDAERSARFEREARVLASLNHPNIAAIYGVEESGGRKFLIMELVPGETLGDRIKRGPIPMEDALKIAVQICEALEAAHENGVVHRDLKPANIKVTPDGRVKVLDFGLAKGLGVGNSGTTDLSNSPTMVTMAETNAGVILGTAAYMSPEQARGRMVDRRTDVFAFGCLLYEMLTGKPAFPGEDFAETLSVILKSEPNYDNLPVDTPPRIRELLRRCLRKDQKSRLRDIGDARIEIIEAESATESAPARAVSISESRTKERIAWAVLVIVTLVTTTFAARYFSHPLPAAEMHVELSTTPTFESVALAMSPNGQTIAYVAESGGQSQIWLRRLDADSAKPLTGTINAVYPFWSPNNRSLGFVADGKLKVIDTESGAVRVLANVPNPRGGSWNQKDIILYTPSNPGVIYQIPAEGGKPVAVTQPRAGLQQANHLFPFFLPDGEHFIFFDAGGPETRGVYIHSLAGGVPRRLFDSETAASYSSGHLFFVQQGMLMAQQFDENQLAIIGNPFQISGNLPGGTQRQPVAVSPTGTIVYRALPPPQSPAVPGYFAWFDRMGKDTGSHPEFLAGGAHWGLSKDGRNFAQEKTTDGNIDIWRIDYGRGVRNRVSMDPVADTFPEWSPNNEHIVFTSNRKSITYDLYVAVADRPGSDELLLSSNENKIATDWSRDGRYILYRNFSATTGYDVWALPVDAQGKKNGEPINVVNTPADERDAQFSPDGNWVAYQSNESGVFEIYVQPFPGGGAKYQVSKGGGAQARWNPSGKELFYIGMDSKLISVPMKLAPDGQHVEAGMPAPVFLTTLRDGELQTTNRQQYAVSPDGQRFLMRGFPITPSTVPLSLIVNWKPESK